MSRCVTRPAVSLLLLHTTGRRATRLPWQMKYRFFKNNTSRRAYYHKDTIARMAETREDASNNANLNMQIGNTKIRGSILNFISDWEDDWVCYWDDSYDLPDDPEQDFVFKPPLQISRCGVVRTKEDDWEGEISESDMEAIRTILNLCDIDSEHYIRHGDESDHSWFPMAIQWSEADGDLTPQTLLKRLGAHPEVMDPIHSWNYREEDDFEDEEERMFEDAFQAFLEKYESRVFFCSGDEKLNPLPCFAMAQVSPTLVAGFVGGVTYT